jgi:VanZ family protein
MLLTLSLLPADRVSTSFPFEISDKIQHFSAYTVLTLLLACTLTAWWGVSDSLLLVTALGAFGYGLLIEALQELMQLGRSAEWGDLLSNTLGILFACVVFRHVVLRYWWVANDR